jgi:ATP-binding cassette, subfamily B, bacterial HlyB/CyaB
VRPETPVETADLAWAFASLCRLLHAPFEPRLFLQQFPPPTCVATLSEAGAALGLDLRRRRCIPRELASMPLPLIVLRRSTEGDATRLGLIIAADARSVLLAERDCAPRSLSHPELIEQYDDELLCAEKAQPSAEQELAAPPFGLRWFVPELLRHRAVWRDVLAASLVMQFLALATPLLTQVIIDKVVVHHSKSTLMVIVLALALFLVFNAALGYVRQYLLLHTGNRIDAVLAGRVFEHLLRLPPRYFEQRPTGTLVARLQGVETIREFLTGASASLVLDLPFAFVFLAVMFWYSVPLSMIALGLIALLALLSAFVTPLLRSRINRQFLAGARNQAFLTEYVSAMDTVKALQLEPQLTARYARNLGDYLAAGFATRHLANVYSVSATALEQALGIAVLAAGAWLVMTSEGFTIGMLVAFQMFASRLAQPVLRLAGLWQEFQQASIAVQRLGDLMDAPTEPWSLRSGRSHDTAASVEIEDLCFRYAADHAPVLEHFNLRIEPGACVALTGPSGSGKSTLARLLLGFNYPGSGAVKIDGHDTRHLSANELRLQFGVVPQETRLFSGTLYDNLVLAQPYAAAGEIVEACRLAEIHEFIDRLPQGYQTPIGEHGAGLSGGQKQRLAIARALLRRPRMLIFDEATSSLDAETAEAIGRTVNRLRGKVTILFIAHRVPQSLQVDVLAELDNRMRLPATRDADRVAHA